jgi:hypothetical protein
VSNRSPGGTAVREINFHIFLSPLMSGNFQKFTGQAATPGYSLRGLD